MKILIIDNNIDPDCWGSADLCSLARQAPDSTLYVRRAPQSDLPKSPREFDRIIVSGSKTSALDSSPWVGQLIEFVKSALNERKPYLGVCYGHQILARSLSGIEAVRKAKDPEFGWTKIQITEPSPLFQNIPSTFYSFSSHYEEVCSLAPGLKVLAHSELCQVQACQLENSPVFGVQFHPEKNLEEAKKLLSKQRQSDLKKSKELYNPEIGKTLFKNFLEAI